MPVRKKNVAETVAILAARPHTREGALYLEDQRTVTFYIPQDIRARCEALGVQRIDATFIRAMFNCLLDKLEDN